jgi:mono/diheme cytochrome c family protein
MRRLLLSAFLLLAVALAVAPTLATSPLAAAAPAAPTFTKDVLPILQKNCQTCHRPGAIAPMSFLTYAETRPYAKAIVNAVRTRSMPPWFADPTVGRFKNTRVLGADDIATIAAWVEKGAPEGDAKDTPAAVDFGDGWTIGKPDIVVTMTKPIELPATGVLDQSYVLARAHFDRDVWVAAAEVRPGNPAVVHHMKAWIRPPGSSWMKDAPEGVLFNPPPAQAGTLGSAGPQTLPASSTGYIPMQDILAKYNPGVAGQDFTTGGAAKFIAAGSDIVFEVHYTTNGQAQSDRSSVGLVLAKAAPLQRHLTITGLNERRFEIPPGAANYEILAESIIDEPAKLVWVQPHMHYRGKDYALKVVYPSGEEKLVVRVPNYRFDWQVGYELAEPIDLPKGAVLKTVSHYDNSRGNKFNPDPTKTIRFGLQSWDEMNVSFMGIVIDAKADPNNAFRGGRRRPQTSPQQ